MRGVRLTVAAALVAAGLSALAGQAVRADPGTAAAPAAGEGPAAGTPSPASLAAEALLRSLVDAPVTIARDVRGLARLVGTTAGHPVPLPAGIAPAAPAPEQALAHLGRIGALFGLLDVTRDLVAEPVAPGLEPAAGEDRIVRFQQLLGGRKVLGGELAVVLDPAGALRSVTAETLPSVGPGLLAEPAVSREKARRTALAVTARAHPKASPDALRASTPERWFLDPALIGIPPQAAVRGGPVWRSEVTGPADVRELVLVDERTGTVPLQLNQIAHALDQTVCDRNNKPDASPVGSDCKAPFITRKAGQGATGVPEVDQAWDNTVRTSRYFEDYLGIDLTALLGVDTGDGKKKLRSTVRFCPDTTLCSATNGTLFDNAFWNGRGVYYGSGWQKADDVVAHELAHGLTDKTSRLLYLYQSGAINESMSDVFGELADLTNGFDAEGLQVPWTVGEDAPLDTFPLRNMADPTMTPLDPQPDRMTSPHYAVDLFFLNNGAVHSNSGVGNKAVYLIAMGTAGEPGGSFNGQTITGLGFAKTSRLYLRVQQMLTSGADYADLGRVLPQACSDLTGRSGFTSADCTEVKRAVTATEMAKQPTGVAAAAAVPEAGYCPTGRRDTFLSDGFENFSKKRWTLGNRWVLIRDYAKTGTYSVYGVEPDFPTSSALTLNPTYLIPRGVRTHLRFDHQYRLDAGIEELAGIPIGPFYDGARLEYRVNGGGWKSATGLPWENGPRKRITPEGGAPYTAFGGDSRGYHSSRVDLSSFAGSKVNLRWRLFGDRQIAFDGWTVDDVRLFACGSTKPSNVDTMSVVPKKKKLTVRWTEPLYNGGGITGYRMKRNGAPAVKVSKNARAYTFTNLKPGKKYTVTVHAIGKGGLGPATTRTQTVKK